MRGRLLHRAAAAAVPVDIRDAGAESLPFDDATFDAVVSTLVLCTVDDIAATLAEIRRVLRPGGRLLFIEHGGDAAGKRGVWQRRLDPVWTKVACGCHLNRDARSNLEQAGFTVSQYEEFSPKRTPPVLLPFAQGVATP